LPRMLKEVQ